MSGSAGEGSVQRHLQRQASIHRRRADGSGFQNLSVKGPAPTDLFSIPLRPIHVVLRLSSQGAFSQRVRVRGVVTLQRLGRSLFISDGQQGVEVQTADNGAQARGSGGGGWISCGRWPAHLERCGNVRKTGTGPPPQPVAVTATALAGGVALLN